MANMSNENKPSAAFFLSMLEQNMGHGVDSHILSLTRELKGGGA